MAFSVSHLAVIPAPSGGRVAAISVASDMTLLMNVSHRPASVSFSPGNYAWVGKKAGPTVTSESGL